MARTKLGNGPRGRLGQVTTLPQQRVEIIWVHQVWHAAAVVGAGPWAVRPSRQGPANCSSSALRSHSYACGRLGQ